MKSVMMHFQKSGKMHTEKITRNDLPHGTAWQILHLEPFCLFLAVFIDNLRKDEVLLP